MTRADFTPTFAVSHDKDAVTFTAVVTDDDVSPGPGGADAAIPEGRGDQVHFQIAPPGGAARSITVRLDAAGRADVRHSGGGPPKKVAAKVERVADGYCLTATVLWSALGIDAPAAGSSLTFNAVAFDADGVNDEHKTEWPWAGGQEFEYDDPRGWGELVFRGQ
jgi:hypothetical protein